MKLRIIAGLLLLGFGALGLQVRGASTAETPDFKEVYDLIRANLAGKDEAELNRAAVQGFLGQLKPQVSLVGDPAQPAPGTNSESGVRSGVFDGAYGYLRIGQVTGGTAQQVQTTYAQLSSSNRLKGVVVDLRFAGGQDYAGATALADLFFAGERPLMDYGQGLKKSTTKTNAMSLPLAVLVNRQTSGAAEAFAAVLRRADIGLVLGTNTAGKAMMGKEFTLKSGQHLWIATALVKLGEGQTFPAAGLAPDIQVEVSPQDEQAYFEDAYKALPKSNGLTSASTNQTNLSVTNRLPHHRTTEAELVRMHRDGETPSAEEPAAKSREVETPPHVVYDPVLARAIDLLKGLSVVQQFRSS